MIDCVQKLIKREDKQGLEPPENIIVEDLLRPNACAVMTNVGQLRAVIVRLV